MRSELIQSGIKMVTGWPRALPIAENEMPVLPLVASAIMSPGLIWPFSYARRSTCSAIRSLMLPVRFTCSYLAYSTRGSPRNVKSMASSGVLPMIRSSALNFLRIVGASVMVVGICPVGMKSERLLEKTPLVQRRCDLTTNHG